MHHCAFLLAFERPVQHIHHQKVQAITVQHFLVFSRAFCVSTLCSVYPHCLVCIHTVLCVSRGSKVVLVPLNSTVVSLSLGPTVVSPRPLLWEDNDDNDYDYDDHQVE